MTTLSRLTYYMKCPYPNDSRYLNQGWGGGKGSISGLSLYIRIFCYQVGTDTDGCLLACVDGYFE